MRGVLSNPPDTLKELLRKRHEPRCLDHDMRGPAPASKRQQHKLANLGTPGARGKLSEPPDTFPTPDRRQRRQLAVLAREDQKIRGVDRGRDHLDQSLAGLEPRHFELDRMDHLLRNRAVPFVLSSEHRGTTLTGCHEQALTRVE